jgi:hypothetical protein
MTLFRFTVYFFFFINILPAHSSIPTVEGLFRYGRNAEFAKNTVLLKLKIEKIKKELPFDIVSEKPDEPAQNETTTEDKNLEEGPVYVKLYFYLDKNSFLNILQIVYNKNSFDANSISRLEILNNLVAQLSSDRNINRNFFYSSLLMFANNNSSGISNLLAQYNLDYTNNTDLMDQDKLELLGLYKDYLVKKKEDKANGETPEEEVESPLRPSEPEQKSIVKETMDKNMYKKDHKVSLVNKNNKYFQFVELSNTKALFDNITHNLDFFRLTIEDQVLESRFYEYILFDGVHQLPKHWVIKNEKEDEYKINFISIRNFQSDSTLKERVKKIRKKTNITKSPRKNLENIFLF